MRFVFSIRLFTLWVVLGSVFGSINDSVGQDDSGFFTDPATGIVYRKVMRTIEKPIVETTMTQRQQTVYKPKTVTETRPTSRRMYIPVTENRWVPQVENRWNPFVAPRVAYKHVPQTYWQVRDEVVAETTTQVHWEPETQTVSVPEQSMRMTREQLVDFEPVGRIPTQAIAQTSSPRTLSPQSNVSPEIAARLRPMAAGTAIEPNSAGISSSLASQAHSRNNLQSGMRATELMPNHAPFIAPAGTIDANGVAGLPPMRIWR